jgi:hypothetical protein
MRLTLLVLNKIGVTVLVHLLYKRASHPTAIR